MPNDIDRTFLRLTIPHHRQGVQLGELAAERGSSEQLREMGRDMAADQAKEIGELEQHLPALGLSAGDVQPPEPKAGAMTQMLEHLSAQPGRMFDASFLAMMMNHHTGAIGVAELEVSGGASDELVGMARSMHEKQLGELAQMREMLAGAHDAGLMEKVKQAVT